MNPPSKQTATFFSCIALFAIVIATSCNGTKNSNTSTASDTTVTVSMATDSAHAMDTTMPMHDSLSSNKNDSGGKGNQAPPPPKHP